MATVRSGLIADPKSILSAPWQIRAKFTVAVKSKMLPKVKFLLWLKTTVKIHGRKVKSAIILNNLPIATVMTVKPVCDGDVYVPDHEGIFRPKSWCKMFVKYYLRPHQFIIYAC